MENIFNSPATIWFIIGIALLIAEVFVSGLFVLFFGIGAIVVSLISFFVDISITMQMAIFIVVSVASLFSLRRSLTKIYGMDAYSNEEEQEFVGKQATVVKDISPPAFGKIELHGARWAATADSPIKKGATVKIVEQMSIKFKVEAI